jgi:hypothetical protein
MKPAGLLIPALILVASDTYVGLQGKPRPPASVEESRSDQAKTHRLRGTRSLCAQGSRMEKSPTEKTGNRMCFSSGTAHGKLRFFAIRQRKKNG